MTDLKRLMSLVLALIFLAVPLFSGCAREDGGENGSGIKILCVNFALYDFAAHIVGDCGSAEMLLTPGVDSHDTELTLKDIAKISEADLFLYNGGEDDEWCYDVLDSLDGYSERPETLRVMEFVPLLEEEHDHDDAHGHSRDHEHGHEHRHEHDHDEDEHENFDGYDEHTWTSIPNAVTILRVICEKLSGMHPEYSAVFETNRDSYIAELDGIDAELRSLVEGARTKTLVFADRFPMRYFAEEYGLDHTAAFSGCTSNTEPTLSAVAEIADAVVNGGVRGILTVELSDKKCASAVKDAVGGRAECEIYELHSAHNVTREDFESGVSYAELWRRNINVLGKVLY